MSYKTEDGMPVSLDGVLRQSVSWRPTHPLHWSVAIAGAAVAIFVMLTHEYGALAAGLFFWPFWLNMSMNPRSAYDPTLSPFRQFAVPAFYGALALGSAALVGLYFAVGWILG